MAMCSQQGAAWGLADIEDEDGLFEEKMARLMAKLEEQSQESAKLEAAIRRNLKEIWHGQ